MIVTDEVYLDEETHTYWETASGLRVVGISELLRAFGYIQDHGDQDAMRRGKNVHLALHYQHMGMLDPASLSPRIRPYFECAMDFHALMGGTCRLTESIVFDPVARLACTLDALWDIKDRQMVIDYKSGAVAEWVKYQTAAAVNGLPAGAYRRWGLSLRDDGKPAQLSTFDNPRDMVVVRQMASLFYTRVNDGVYKWAQTKSAMEAQRRKDNVGQLFIAI